MSRVKVQIIIRKGLDDRTYPYATVTRMDDENKTFEIMNVDGEWEKMPPNSGAFMIEHRWMLDFEDSRR